MPWSRVLNFNDPFPFQTAIQTADVEIFPTVRGNFGSELTQIAMERLWMLRVHQHLPQINTVCMRPGRRIIGFLGKQQTASRHCGVDVFPGDIIVYHFDVLHQRSDADFHYGSMSLPADDFDAACEAITGHAFRKLPLAHLVRPSPVLMSRLTSLHETVGRIAETSPDLLELPEVIRALEQQLIHLMMRCLTEGALSEKTVGGCRHETIVARFERLLEAHPGRPHYLAEICAAIAVSERTLRAACEEHFGMGPVRYLFLRRMHLVHRALLQADASTATVTRLATDHGFWELGRFSVAYRNLFGESPSESLRRPRDDERMFPNRPSSFATPLLHAR